MKARTISGERLRLNMIPRARFLQWAESRLERAAAVGMKSADAARMDVNKKADCFLTNSSECKLKSNPHLVCAR